MYAKQIKEARQKYEKFIARIANYDSGKSAIANVVESNNIEIYTKKIPAEPAVFSIVQLDKNIILIDDQAIEKNAKSNDYDLKLYPYFFGGIQVAHLLLRHCNIFTKKDNGENECVYLQQQFPLYEIGELYTDEDIETNFLAKELIVPNKKLLILYEEIAQKFTSVETETGIRNITLKNQLLIEYLSDAFNVEKKLMNIILQEREII